MANIVCKTWKTWNEKSVSVDEAVQQPTDQAASDQIALPL